MKQPLAMFPIAGMTIMSLNETLILGILIGVALIVLRLAYPLQVDLKTHQQPVFAATKGAF